MEKKNLDWGNLGFGYMTTDYRYVANYKDGKWDDGAKQKYQHDLTEFLHDFTNPPLFTIHDIIHFSYSHFNRKSKGT